LAKTVQALKISATVALNRGTRQGIEEDVLPAPLGPVTVATAKLRITHAIAARYDDPAYSARVTERVAAIKADLAKLGDVEAWHVTAGAVPADEAEALTEPEKKVAEDGPPRPKNPPTHKPVG